MIAAATGLQANPMYSGRYTVSLAMRLFGVWHALGFDVLAKAFFEAVKRGGSRPSSPGCVSRATDSEPRPETNRAAALSLSSPPYPHPRPTDMKKPPISRTLLSLFGRRFRDGKWAAFLPIGPRAKHSAANRMGV